MHLLRMRRADIIVMFEEHSIGQTPSSLERRYLVRDKSFAPINNDTKLREFYKQKNGHSTLSITCALFTSLRR